MAEITTDPARAALASKSSPGPDVPERSCRHCGTGIPTRMAGEFCCAGCSAVYAAIGALGLAGYYENERPASPPARVTGRGFAEFDDPSFLGTYGRALPGGLFELELLLEGLHCASCAWLIERLPSRVSGLASSEVDLGRRSVRARFDPLLLAPSELARAFDRLGYTPHAKSPLAEVERQRRVERTQWIRLGIAGALFGNAMLVSFALYGGAFSGMEPEHRALLRGYGLLLTVLAVLGPGAVFLRGALGALRLYSMHMDVPVALALVAGTLWGAYNTFTGRGEVYFESLTAVVFLLLVGRTIQARQELKARDQVRLLDSLTPKRVRRLERSGEGAQEVEREVPLAALRQGDRVRLLAGDLVPADGPVLAGRGRLDLSLLTGESRPVELDIGDWVQAGTSVLEGPLVFQAERLGADSRLGRLVESIAEGSRAKPPIVRLADRVAQRFVVLVLGLALLTLALWWSAGPDQAWEHAIALLIVTCPCALGLATPLAIQVALGRAARIGLLIKGGESLERLARAPGTVVFDKTGTLTEPAVHAGIEGLAPSLLACVAALERFSNHPLGRALAALGPGADAEPLAVERVREQPGLGIGGWVQGRELLVGGPALLESHGIGISAAWRAREQALLRGGETPVWIAEAGQVQGLLGIAQRLRPEAFPAVQRLLAMGWDVRLLSGDRQPLVLAAAAELGLPPEAAQAECSPEQKLAALAGLKSKGPVVMVGDGVNDAACLAQADVGVAVSGGAEASLEAADVVIGARGLDQLPVLIEGSRASLRAMRANVWASLGYNAIAGGAAIAGLVHPVLAAILMPLSSLTVITLSWRAETFPQPPIGPPGRAEAGDPPVVLPAQVSG